MSVLSAELKSEIQINFHFKQVLKSVQISMDMFIRV
jgi:hypothetical protein